MCRTRVTILGTVLALALASTAAAGRVEIQFVTTNDIHGNLREGSSGSGGLGALANLVDELRAREAREEGFGMVLTDSGDLFSGGAEDGLTRGKVMTAFALALDYDALAIGNHDFDHGLAMLKEHARILREKGIPLLGLNLVNKETRQLADEIVAGSTIVEEKGIKIGLIGVTTPGIPAITSPSHFEGLDVLQPVPLVQAEVDRLKAQGVENIVLLSHVGFEDGRFLDEKKMAHEVGGLLAVLGGHSHTLTGKAHIDESSRTVVVQSGSNLRTAGQLSFFFDPETGKVLDEDGDGPDFVWKVVDLRRREKDSPIAEAFEKEHLAPIDAQLSEELARVETRLDRRHYKTDSALGNLLADAALDAVPEAEIAFLSTLGMRADGPREKFLLKDAFRILPFANALVTLTVDGASLKKIIDGRYGGGRGFYSAAGMTVRVDSRKPRGERVLRIEVAGEEVQDDKKYRMVTEDYVASGKGGFREFQDLGPASPTPTDTRQALIAHLKKVRTVTRDHARTGRFRDEMLEVTVGETRITLTGSPASHPSLHDLMALSVLRARPEAQLALLGSGNISWKLSPDFPIRLRDLFELTPWNDPIMLVTITGAQLTKGLMEMAKNSRGRGFPAHVAGARVVIRGEKVEVQVGDSPVDDGQSYRMATTESVAAGRGPFWPFGSMNLPREPATKTLRLALEEGVSSLTPLEAKDFPTNRAIDAGPAAVRMVFPELGYESMSVDILPYDLRDSLE